MGVTVPTVEVDPTVGGTQSAVGILSKAAAGLNFADGPGLEVLATALAIEMTGPVWKHDQTKVDGTRVARIDTLFSGFHLLNRATVGFDSLRVMATEYLASMQAAPITGRYQHPFLIDGNPLMWGMDVRGVPYAGADGKVHMGGSVHLFAGGEMTSGGRLKDTNNKVASEGEVYLAPTLMLAAGQRALMKTVLEDTRKQLLAGVDVRFGYRSFANKDLDIGIMAQCTAQKLQQRPCSVSLIGGTSTR